MTNFFFWGGGESHTTLAFCPTSALSVAHMRRGRVFLVASCHLLPSLLDTLNHSQSCSRVWWASYDGFRYPSYQLKVRGGWEGCPLREQGRVGGLPIKRAGEGGRERTEIAMIPLSSSSSSSSTSNCPLFLFRTSSLFGEEPPTLSSCGSGSLFGSEVGPRTVSIYCLSRVYTKHRLTPGTDLLMSLHHHLQ